MAKNPNPTPHIYLITNTINGKIYVGQTNDNDKCYLGGGSRLTKAQKKYGRKNFIKTILMPFNDFNRRELDFWEDFYIELFSCRDRNIGYNANKGGIQGARFVTEETRAKFITYQNTPEAQARRLENAKKSAITRIGMKHSQERRRNISIGKFGNKEIEIYKMNKLVHTCFFQQEAADYVGRGRTSVDNCLNNRSKTVNGFTLKYKEVING